MEDKQKKTTVNETKEKMAHAVAETKENVAQDVKEVNNDIKEVLEATNEKMEYVVEEVQEDVEEHKKVKAPMWKKIICTILVLIILGALGMLAYKFYGKYVEEQERKAYIQQIVDNIPDYYPCIVTLDYNRHEFIPDLSGHLKYLSEKGKGIVATRTGFLYPIPLNPNYEIKNVNFTEWQSKYNEIIAYIEFETLPVISYPVFYRESSDYYLKHNRDGVSIISGEIYVEGLIKDGHSSTNTIVYGHNMRNGSMFGSLKKYKDQAYYAGNEFFWYYTPKGKYRYQIFSVYDTLYTSDAFTWYAGPCPEYTSYLQMVKSWSKYDTGVTPEPTDEIITLCTCTSAGGNYRWVVQGRLVYKEEYGAATVGTPTPIATTAPTTIATPAPTEAVAAPVVPETTVTP